jgi:hypothetical protein
MEETKVSATHTHRNVFIRKQGRSTMTTTGLVSVTGHITKVGIYDYLLLVPLPSKSISVVAILTW